MIAILSPAKRLNEGPAVADLPQTTPVLLDRAEQVAKKARRLSAPKLQELMGISDKLATLNRDRFQAWSADQDSEEARQAALLFAGDTYVGLEAQSLDADDLAFAQDHVAILSGLYGLLRPLDLTRPYRLEMGTKLGIGRAPDLYAFWGDDLRDTLVGWLDGHDDRTIVNLASNEYAKAARLDTMDVRVITPVFQDVKDGKARVIGMFAKKARGAMARWIVTHRVHDAEALKAAAIEGYAFVAQDSDATRWVFRREQPTPGK